MSSLNGVAKQPIMSIMHSKLNIAITFSYPYNLNHQGNYPL